MSSINALDNTTFSEGKYIGYYWYSDQTSPELLTEAISVDSSIFTELPFIVEGAFYDEKNHVSIQVKNIDGQYQVQKVKIDQSEDASRRQTVQYYKSHDLKGVSQYKVIEMWEEIEDECLENMKTLVPAYTVFAGFGR